MAESSADDEKTGKCNRLKILIGSGAIAIQAVETYIK